MRAGICDTLGIEIPIVQAPIQAPTGAVPALQLAAAVCEAGGLGTLPLWRADIDTLRARLQEFRALTTKPFAVNLNLDFPQEERLDACLAERVPIISFFWGDGSKIIPRAKAGGAMVLQTVGSAEEGRAAIRYGADIVVAHGWEAGGHVWGTVATMALVPAVVDAVEPAPVVAAGGIADGRGMAAALALGASGVWMGTRFLASSEVQLHALYRERLLQASEADTVHLQNLFDIGWPEAPHRVLRNKTVRDWEAAGRPDPGNRPGEGDIVAHSKSRGEVMRSVIPPLADVEGDIDSLAMWAGQGVGLVKATQPAAEIVREIDAEAAAILQQLAGTLG